MVKASAPDSAPCPRRRMPPTLAVALCHMQSNGLRGLIGERS